MIACRFSELVGIVPAQELRIGDTIPLCPTMISGAGT